MRTRLRILGIAVMAIVLQTVARADERREATGTDVRIGTFDSRAVAIAYYRSAAFQKLLQEKRTKQREAKEAGDLVTVERLEAEGRQLQDRINRQGFGDASVRDLIQLIEGELAVVSEHTGVDVIVSRWDVIFQRPDVRFVDVTDQLVQRFKPDDATLKAIAEVATTKPVPVNQLHVDK